MTANSLVEYDRAHWIHPVASWRDHEERGATILRSGKGAYLTDIEGRELLDGFAGLWCVNIGYGQESVVAAATEQIRRLPYATGHFHFASDPAIQLPQKLADRAPGQLEHVIFSLGGSDESTPPVPFIMFFSNHHRPHVKTQQNLHHI